MKINFATLSSILKAINNFHNLINSHDYHFHDSYYDDGTAGGLTLDVHDRVHAGPQAWLDLIPALRLWKSEGNRFSRFSIFSEIVIFSSRTYQFVKVNKQRRLGLTH